MKKLLVYRNPNNLDSTLVFVESSDDYKKADRFIWDDCGMGDYDRVAELEVSGTPTAFGEIYILHAYDG